VGWCNSGAAGRGRLARESMAATMDPRNLPEAPSGLKVVDPRSRAAPQGQDLRRRLSILPTAGLAQPRPIYSSLSGSLMTAASRSTSTSSSSSSSSLSSSSGSRGGIVLMTLIGPSRLGHCCSSRPISAVSPGIVLAGIEGRWTVGNLRARAFIGDVEAAAAAAQQNPPLVGRVSALFCTGIEKFV
jgi:hypothetical protein